MKLDETLKFDNIVQALAFHAANSPDKIAYRYLKDGEIESGKITYSQLYDTAQNLATELLRLANRGDRALLLYPQGIEFVTALYACFLSGIIAVPIYPPSGKRRTERLENVAKDCDPVLALTSKHTGSLIEQWFLDKPEIKDFKWLYTDTVHTNATAEHLDIHGADIALLQYTSGSTGDPKGVEITHTNLVHNNHELLRAVDGCTEVVCWLPVYHDMGLIGNLIFVVYCGGTLTLMSPVDFVRKPVRWFKALSDYKANGTGAPNFAYDLCTRYISDADLEGIDLSHWHATCNGAEPIRPDTLRKFTERFSKVGFREEVFVPCYGLAEATALVAGGRNAIHYLKLKVEALLNGKIEIADDTLAPNAIRELASSGPPALGMKIEIVNPNSLQRCAPNEVGEIWIQGKSVARGYWQKPELNREIFHAEISDINGKPLVNEGKWLRSGDMGFMHNGMLYISGRLKEMLVISGTNIFPQDIERTIQDMSPVFEENSGAVFGVEGERGNERIVAFQEVARHSISGYNPVELFKEVSRQVLAINEISLSGIYLISPGRLPKTTSGKIKRLECAKAYQNKEIPGLLHFWDIMDVAQDQNKQEKEAMLTTSQNSEAIQFTTLVDAIAYYSEKKPNEIAYRYLIDGEIEGAILTRREVHTQSKAIAAKLLELAKPGDRIILLYPSGLEFITAFFGCLMAGLIAVPMYPPSGRRRLERLESVAKDCAPVLALSLSVVTEQAKAWFSERDALKDIVWLNSDQIRLDQQDTSLPPVSPDAVAFLQYTSGSTGDPKGVEVTHANIVHNNHMTTFALTPLKNIVSWLPIYHDMGLIGNILLSAYVGVPLTLMSPVDFIRKPIRWLQAITKYKPELSGAPNFAFDLCTQQITDEEMEGLDLSSYSSACNGAEPVKPSTLKKFNERFAKVGFSSEAFLPCYGMAEATLMVTGKYGCNTPIEVDSDAMLDGKIVRAKDHPNIVKKREVVSSGPLLPEMRVEIVNPETKQRMPKGIIGEIWIQGDSVAKGYWNRPKLTKETFQARILDENNEVLEKEGAFLRSGDMGFMDEGLLYITGRLKEMLIIGGANIYPQDVERTVQSAHEDLQENAGAVFSVEAEGSTDKVVIFQEISRLSIRDYNADKIFNAISKEVILQHELPIAGIYLISPGGIPKTTSGKIQRTKCKQSYLEGDIPKVLDFWDISSIKKKQ